MASLDGIVSAYGSRVQRRIENGLIFREEVMYER